MESVDKIKRALEELKTLEQECAEKGLTFFPTGDLSQTLSHADLILLISIHEKLDDLLAARGA